MENVSEASSEHLDPLEKSTTIGKATNSRNFSCINNRVLKNETLLQALLSTRYIQPKVSNLKPSPASVHQDFQQEFIKACKECEDRLIKKKNDLVEIKEDGNPVGSYWVNKSAAPQTYQKRKRSDKSKHAHKPQKQQSFPKILNNLILPSEPVLLKFVITQDEDGIPVGSEKPRKKKNLSLSESIKSNFTKVVTETNNHCVKEEIEIVDEIKMEQDYEGIWS